MGLRSADQHPFFFEAAQQTEGIHDHQGDVVVLEPAGMFSQEAVHLFAEAVDWKRGERNAAVAAAAQQFADVLAQECAQNPLQWFNFYDFWKAKQHDG